LKTHANVTLLHDHSNIQHQGITNYQTLS